MTVLPRLQWGARVTNGIAQILPVYIASDITVSNGANLGDDLSFADELDLDDVYEVSQTAAAQRLIVAPGKGSTLAIASGSPLGRTGHAVHLDATLTMMTATGDTTELVVMVEVDSAGDVEAVYALPLSQLIPQTEYTLIDIDLSSARTRFSEVACMPISDVMPAAIASGRSALAAS